ncbi:MFS transporter [Streptomyces sp. 840.1]|uniref:MFS transporter n=1 Tax=Streptomyces sp. 840.1 TaxID=2485152 RepID=UPI000F497159|nr:MFS transporter [Streptomyces sp. 840.1]ROQ57396.1 MFS transporter [Streptomyces sp. 840.1]
MASPLATLREFSPRTRVVLSVNALNSFGGGLVLPFLWIYLSEVRGLPAWVPAVTLAVQAGTAVAGGLLWGSLLDRFPPRVTVPVVMAVAGIGTALYAQATGVYTALTAALVYGFGISGVGTVLRYLYAGAASARERGLAYSADYAVFNAMTGLGVLVGGLVASMDAGSRAVRFSVLYLTDGATFLLAGAALFWLLPKVVKAAGKDEEGATGRRRAGYREVLTQRHIGLLLAALAVCSLVSYGQFRSGLPGYLTQGGALGPEGISGAFAVNILVAVGAQVLLADRIQRIRRSTVFAVSGAVWAVAWALVLAAGLRHGGSALALAMAGVVLLSVGEALVFPVVTSLLNDLAAEHIRGRVNALLSVAVSTGSVAGPALAGALLPWADGLGLMAALLAGCLAVVAVAVRLRTVLGLRVDLPAPQEKAAEVADDSAAGAPDPDAAPHRATAEAATASV